MGCFTDYSVEYELGNYVLIVATGYVWGLGRTGAGWGAWVKAALVTSPPASSELWPLLPSLKHLTIGSLLFDQEDLIDIAKTRHELGRPLRTLRIARIPGLQGAQQASSNAGVYRRAWDELEMLVEKVEWVTISVSDFR